MRFYFSLRPVVVTFGFSLGSESLNLYILRCLSNHMKLLGFGGSSVTYLPLPPNVVTLGFHLRGAILTLKWLMPNEMDRHLINVDHVNYFESYAT